MGMTLITEIEFGTNYPENILISPSEKHDSGKYSAYCYLTRNGDIHKLMLSTRDVFDSKESATEYFNALGKSCAEKYRDYKSELNYRKQDDSYENRNKNCDNCQDLFRVSPYKNRCMLIGIDVTNKKLSIALDGVCDKFNPY